MGRIDTILEHAASATGSVENVLLQCVILADELDYEPLATWANREISGYEHIDDVPDYRKGHSGLRGTLFQGNRYSTGYEVPSSWIEESLRARATTVVSFAGIGQIASSASHEDLSQTYSGIEYIEAQINLRLRNEFGPFVYVEGLRLPLPVGFHDQVITAVRHRIVQFMLELRKLFPNQEDIGENLEAALPAVDEKFKTVVLHVDKVDHMSVGGEQVITDNSQHLTINVASGDFDSLGQFLHEQGFLDEQIERLRPIAEQIQEGIGTEETEQSLKQWMGEQLSELPKKGIQTAGDATKKAAIGAIVSGLTQYAPKMASWISHIDFNSLPGF